MRPKRLRLLLFSQNHSHLSPEELLGVFLIGVTLGKMSLAAGDSFDFGSRRRRLTERRN